MQRQENNLEQAVQSFRTESLKPDHPHAYNNLGDNDDLGMVKEAIHCYVTAIGCCPPVAAHSNLACFEGSGKLDRASPIT